MSCTDPCIQTRTSPILLPRTHWDDHPRFPQQTLLLRSHESFRRLSAALIRSADSADFDDRRRLMTSYRFRSWQQAMRGHEHYEESKLYPYLRRRFGVSTSSLQAGHDGLHQRADDVISALDRGDSADVVIALRAYDDLLRSHLDAEELLVIPLLLQMSPDEFHRYTHHGIRRLLADLDECETSSPVA